ncbi:MAG: oligosaccharide flippase family protein [Christensenellales bacterium]
MDKKIRTGILMTYFMGVAQVIVNIFFTGALVRFLGDIEFGLYMLLGSLAAYVTVFDLGLNNTISRYVAKYKQENNKEKESSMLFITFIIYGMIMLIILTIGLLMMSNLQLFIKDIPADHAQLAQTLFLLLVINLAITLPLSSFSAILVGYEQFVYTRTISIIRVLAMPLISIPLLYLGGNSVAVVAVTTATNIAAGLCNAVYAFKKHKIKLKLYSFDKYLIKELLLYSSAVFLGVIADQVFFNTGNIVLGVARGPADVSAFGVSNQLVQYLVAVAAAFSGVYLPRATRVVMERSSKHEVSQFFSKSSKPLAVILLFILGGYILLGQEFIHFWIKEKLSDVYALSLIIIIPTIWTLTRTLGVSVMQAMNLHGYRSKLLLVRALVNCVICFLVVGKYGYFGIAVSYAFCIIVSNTILDFYYEKRMGITVFKYTLDLWPIALAGLIAAVITGASYIYLGYSLLAFILRGVFYAGLFAVLLYLLYLKPDERKKVRSMVKRVLGIIPGIGGSR